MVAQRLFRACCCTCWALWARSCCSLRCTW
jgi:hypothetical protein